MPDAKFPKVLIGCPTSDHKAYCLQQYVQGIRALSYPAFDVLLVDNSRDEAYAARIKSLGIPVLRDEYREGAKTP